VGVVERWLHGDCGRVGGAWEFRRGRPYSGGSYHGGWVWGLAICGPCRTRGSGWGWRLERIRRV
jgi:hypothetical protein